MSLDFSVGNTTNTESVSLKVTAGAIDIKESHLNEENQIDWEAFDEALDSEGALIIDRTLGLCLNRPDLWYNSYDSETGDSSDNLDLFNAFNGEFANVTSTFHQINNYNALALFFRLEDSIGVENICQFTSKMYSIELFHSVVFEAALDSTLYANVKGRADISPYQGMFRYVGISDDNQTDKHLIERPMDILYHFIEQELGLGNQFESFMDEDTLNTARACNTMPSLAFSIKEKTNGKELISNICKNSMLFPHFKSTGKFSLISLWYGSSATSGGIDTVQAKDVISYSYDMTPIEKIYTMLNTKKIMKQVITWKKQDMLMVMIFMVMLIYKTPMLWRLFIIYLDLNMIIWDLTEKTIYLSLNQIL